MDHRKTAVAWATLAVAALGVAARAAPPAGYTLAWADEFNAGTLDTSLWHYRTDTRFWSTQLPANVTVGGGYLRLNLKKETSGSSSYTGAGVISKPTFRYGYYETSMQTPPGAGWHTSFWMMRYGAGGGTGTTVAYQELDALENDSIKPTSYSVNVHRWQPTHATFGTKTIASPDLSAGFHTIGCEFMPNVVRYFLDGAVVQTVDATQFPHGDLNVWLTSIAAPLGGTPAVDDTLLPAVALYDYARYYAPTVSTAPVAYRWLGASGTAWSGTAGWDAATGRGVSGTTANAILTVASGTGGSLVHDRSLGTTRYYNVYGSGLLVGAAGTDGSLTITGGTFSTLNASAADQVADESGASGTITVAGGAFIGNIFGTTLAPPTSGTARLIVTAGTATLTTLTLGGTAGTPGSAAVELAGGTLVANRIRAGSAGGTSQLTFDGGQLSAGAASTTFLEGLDSVRIRSRGATIDTRGASVTVAQPLLADPASPGGGLTKSGSGTLTLDGTNNYAGGTTIRGGTLAIAADNRLGAAGGDIALDGGGLKTLASFTMSSSRSISVGAAGGTLENAGSGNLVVAGGVTGAGAALTVRTSSAVNGAAFLDGAVDLGRLLLSGSTTGVGLRQSATVVSAITAAPGQTLHLNGLNGSGTATATYRGFDVVLAGGTFRNRFGGNTFSRTLSLAADGTLENRVGNGNSFSLVGGTVALGTSTLTVRSGTSSAEWVAIGSRLTGGTGSGVVVAGGGRLRLSGSNPGFDGRVMIEQGELRIESAAAVDAGVTIVFGGGTSATKALTLDGVDVVVGRLELSGAERIDLGTGALTVASGLSPERLVAALVAGRGDGSWRGATGILSSAVASDLAAGRPRVLGWVATGDGAMRVAYAAPGDTNIDQVIDVLDVANVLAGGAFDTGLPASWLQGDFNYDGLVDIIDLADFLGGGLFDAGPYAAGATPGMGVIAVPEPAFHCVWPLLLAMAARYWRRPF